MVINNWKKSEIYGMKKWYHKELGNTLELWQSGSRRFIVYISKFGSLEKKSLGDFKSATKAVSFMKRWMKAHPNG